MMPTVPRNAGTVVVLEVRTDTREIKHKRYPCLIEECRRPNSAPLQNGWRVESTGRENDFRVSRHVEDAVIVPRSYLHYGRPRSGNALCVYDSNRLVLHEKVVVGPSLVDFGIVTKPGVGAPGCLGVFRDWDPAQAFLVTAGAFCDGSDIHVIPGASHDMMIGPEKWGEAGVDGSSPAIR